MYQDLVSNQFFIQNPLEEDSPQRFAYGLLVTGSLEEEMAEKVLETLDPERRDQILEERRMIEAETDPQAIFQLLRKQTDTMNRPALAKKALEYEDVIMPKVVERLVSNYHDTFIENAARLLAKSKADYTEQLAERYEAIRSPYVKSLLCVVMGLRAGEERIPWMVERYRELNRQFPDETYDQGPLLALHEMKARFYGTQK